MPRYADNGSINVTVVDGTSFTGVMANDGSLNVIVADGTYFGLYHPCGAIQVTAVDGSTFVGFYAMDGSMNVLEGTSRASGATPVTVVSGSLASSLAAELAAGESDALAIVFNDVESFYPSTGFYGSVWVLDTATPANDYDNSPDTAEASLLSYTSPSPKNILHADGEYKYAAHNLTTYSEDGTNAVYTRQYMLAFGSGSESAVETYQGISYDKHVPSSSTIDPHYIRQSISTVGPARIEIRAKAGGYDKIAIYAGGPNEAVGFDLASGTINTDTSAWSNPPIGDYGIEDLGGGHYLCWLESSTSITTARIYFLGSSWTDPIFAGDETSGVNLGGFAVRYAPSDNTYLKTTDSARYALPIEFDANGDPIGLLVEPERTNLFLNSDTGATQDCSVTAVAHTLSFWGTGTVTLSGASSAGPLVGTGADDRVSLSFTPSAGTLTLTISGTCSRVQLEAGSSASSYIRTLGSTVTRSRDDITGLASTFPFSATHGTLLCEYIRRQDAIAQQAVSIDGGSTSNTIFVLASDTSAARAQVNTGGVTQANQGAAHIAINTVARQAMSWASNSVRGSLNGSAFTEDTSVTLPTVDRIRLGNRAGGGNALDGHLRSVVLLPRQMSQAEIDAWTAGA